MIVRILGEGQYDVADESMEALNVLDAGLESAIEAGDQAAFEAALTALLDGVRTAGSTLDDEALDASDLILPPADASIEDVRELLTGDGLIPG